MDKKTTFDNFDATKSGGPFENGSYTAPENETKSRKQLGFPLKELLDYINKIVNIKKVSNEDKVVQLKITDNNLIQYSLDGETWVDIESGGHKIYDKYGVQLAQKTKLQFLETDVQNVGDMTIVTGIRGPRGNQGERGIQGPQGPRGFDGAKGDKGDKGDDGQSFKVLGLFATYNDLITAHPTGNEGDAYAVGTSVSNVIYNWDIDVNEWKNIGALQGPQGPQGETGQQGPAGEQGEAGPKGDKGDTGDEGPTGPQGPQGVGIVSGGTTGQFYRKKSNTDYDGEWANIQLEQTYSTITIGTTGWTATTLESEDCFYLDVTLIGATSGKHPVLSLLSNKPSTMGDEIATCSLFIKFVEGTDKITVYAKEIPTTSVTMQVKDY